MPKKTIEEKIKAKITKKEISMKPRWYFVLGFILLTISTTSFLVMILFLTNISFYRLRAYNLMSFPIEFLVVNVISMLIAFYLLKKYDFSYKKNIGYLFIGFLLLIVIASFFFDMLGFNRHLMRKKSLQRFYQHRLPKPIPSPQDYFFRRPPPCRVVK